MHISKRDTISLSKAWSIRAIAILLALIVDGIIIYAIVKMNPLKVYVSLASGAFGTSKRMWFTIRDCMILTCIAIGLAPAFKMRFWNVGAEGQMLVGGIATAFWMINFAGKMNIVMLFLCMAISAIVAGGIWGLSGALCGFAGFLAVSAVSHTLSTETAGGRGFTAIIVAWLAKMNPFVMILISALLSFLDKGAVQIASDFGLNEYVSQIISGVILFFILGSEFFINYQVKAGGKHK